ncbi:hypothetical protein AB1Y20_020419 [Prymnesium parvum]|uniref:Uncharacterized protein n=1 Tax=Prymnesium parvum TaxID=97485 RepID=A0AB34JY21_PRYPA
MEYGSGPTPVTCGVYTAREACPPQCWWCDETDVCVLHWTLCQPPSGDSTGGAGAVLVPLLVLVFLLGGGALLSFRWSDGSEHPQDSISVLARDGLEGTAYRRGHYAGMQELELSESGTSCPPLAEGERLLSNVCE